MTTETARFERACEWFMELREQPQSQEVVTRWLDWCREDPLNRAAFDRARAVWQATSEVRTQDLDLPGRKLATFRRTWRVAPWSAAAAAACVAALGALFIARSQIDPALTTPASVNRFERLADGSVIVLGADSRLLTSFDAHSRRLTLERGEAYFRVARDRNRPFIVSAGGLSVTAVGTAFNVRTAPDRVVVAVSEGTVAIDPSAKAARSSVKPNTRVPAGQQIAVDISGKNANVMRIEPAAVASWQTGHLQFTREPLRAVLASVNRYSDRHVELGDPALGELRFTGTVFADRVDDWLRGLPTVFPVSVREEGKSVVVIPREEN
jgi:transmembrane sensor